MLEFTNTKLSDDSGFVAVDDKNKFVVVSFRGTLSKLNWKVDLTLTRRATAWCEGCFVHKGFWEAWQEIRGKIIPLVKQARIEHPDYRVRITGHSLGAAIATLAATEFRMMDPHYLNITELYSYGSPRIANRELAIYMTSLSTLSYRITAMDDAVPRSPFAWWGYRHISPEYWIFRNSNNPKADEIEVLEGYYNPHGNSRTHWLAIEAHRGYFGPISNCATAK
ncbi:hypothetical protein MMC30_006893 [Trapelia coarctata]|nr:hypothetical protein [Trapelia coarctata]